MATDIQRKMTRLTLSSVGRTLFGMDLGAQHERAGKAFGATLHTIGRRGPGLLHVPLWLPSPENRRFRSTLGELDQMIYRVIREFRAGQAQNANQIMTFLRCRPSPAPRVRVDQRIHKTAEHLV